MLALGARPSYSCDHSFADQISLELREPSTANADQPRENLYAPKN
jgi:hypothetical protein